MSSVAKEHIRDKLRCRPNDAVASARFRESARRVSVYLSAFTFLSVVFIEFLPRFCLVS